MTPNRPPPGLLPLLVGDGRPLVTLTGLVLCGCGAFSLFLGVTGVFLPHDLAFLGTDSADLWAYGGGRAAKFMIHDRVSFGGAVAGIGVLYLYLSAVPLRGETHERGWAWWAVLLSSLVGYAGFGLYLGRGYFDSWRGAVSFGLLVPIACGLWVLRRGSGGVPPLGSVLRGGWPSPRGGRVELGRCLLVTTALCLMLGGAVIAVCGMTTVFVPQDLEYLGLTPEEMCGWNPNLVPLIAHDRAGFGSAVASCGAAMLLIVLHGRVEPPWRQALCVMAACGFGAGIAVHYPIGYTSATHLAPAYAGAAMAAAGVWLTRPGRAAGPAGQVPDRTPTRPAAGPAAF